jgi:hypothetical protein
MIEGRIAEIRTMYMVATFTIWLEAAKNWSCGSDDTSAFSAKTKTAGRITPSIIGMAIKE